MQKKRRPWNATNEQVYSISSLDAEGQMNMNIATYVSCITMKPKRYLIAVYRNTKTYENIYDTNKPFLLQALALNQMLLVALLGKKSGLKVNKTALLEKKHTGLSNFSSHQYLTNSFFILSLIPESYITVGDHDLVIAALDKVIEQNNVIPLMTSDLQKAGIIG